MARIMAFDYGTKRIGLAVTDPLQLIATGLCTIHPKEAIDFINKYLQSETVSCFVLGYPRQLNGADSDNAQHVKGFATLLKKNFKEIPIQYIDERFTSVMAQQAILQSGAKKSQRQDKALVDTVSATLILQYYMETLT